MQVSHKRTYQVRQYEPMTIEFTIEVPDDLAKDPEKLMDLVKYLQMIERKLANSYKNTEKEI